MPHDLHGWIRRIKVDRARPFARCDCALDRLLVEARRDPTILGRDLKLQDIANASGRLEGTYIIRLFAEFETGLRLFWATIRDTEPPTQHLLDGIAARRGFHPIASQTPMRCESIGTPWCMSGTRDMAPISIAEARGSLCRFFAFLPPTW